MLWSRGQSSSLSPQRTTNCFGIICWKAHPLPTESGASVVNPLIIYVWVFFWILYSVPLVYVSILVPTNMVWFRIKCNKTEALNGERICFLSPCNPLLIPWSRTFQKEQKFFKNIWTYPGLLWMRAITRAFKIGMNHAVSSSFSLPTLEIHITPWVDGLSQYLDHPENINNFVNSATRQCLEFNKICIPQKSVLLTDPCWVDGVERQRKGHQDQFAAHLQKPLLLQMSLNKCWPTETPSGHVLYGSEGWWKYVGLIRWQIQQHCTPSPP